MLVENEFPEKYCMDFKTLYTKTNVHFNSISPPTNFMKSLHIFPMTSCSTSEVMTLNRYSVLIPKTGLHSLTSSLRPFLVED